MKEEEPQYTDDDVQALFDVPPPYQGQPTRLPLPLCIPQHGSGITKSFARCYSPCLPPSHIQSDDWLAFIDGLNTAFTASPPLRVLNAAGVAISLVPNHVTIPTGMLIQGIAHAAMHVTSNRLTDRYLKHANEKYFGPRGLKVHLAKTAAVAQMVGLGSNKPPQGKVKKVAKLLGRNVEYLGLHVPWLRDLIVKCHHTPKMEVDPHLSVTERRLQMFGGRICPIDLNVPQEPPSGTKTKSRELAEKWESMRRIKVQADAARARQTLAIREGRAPEGAVPLRSQKDAKKVEEAQKAAMKDRQAGVDPASAAAKSKERKKAAIADRMEMTETKDMLWIVVTNIGAGIDEDTLRTIDAKPNGYSSDTERYQVPPWDGHYSKDGWQDSSSLTSTAGPSRGSAPWYHSSPDLNEGWHNYSETDTERSRSFPGKRGVR